MSSLLTAHLLLSRELCVFIHTTYTTVLMFMIN